MEEWKVKIWENNVTNEYLTYLPDYDVWSFPLEDWVYHSVAECALLYGAITGKVSATCDALMQFDKLNDAYDFAVKHIKADYVNRYNDFASFRLVSKMNDLLFLVDRFDELLTDRPEVWEIAVYTLAEEIKESGIKTVEKLSAFKNRYLS